MADEKESTPYTSSQAAIFAQTITPSTSHLEAGTWDEYTRIKPSRSEGVISQPKEKLRLLSSLGRFTKKVNIPDKPFPNGGQEDSEEEQWTEAEAQEDKSTSLEIMVDVIFGR